MTRGDLYYINQRGEQRLAENNITLVNAKKMVEKTREIANHINFNHPGTCYSGSWMLLIRGQGWKTL